MNTTTDTVNELQKVSRQKKKVNKQHHVAVEKSTFAKESAKKDRKSSTKKILNQYKYNDYEDYEDYDEWDDDYESFERFGRR